MIKVLSKYINGVKSVSIWTPILTLLEVILEMIIPLLMASLIDKGVDAGNINHIYYIALWMIVLTVVSLVIAILGGSCGAKASTGFARNVRKGMFEKIQTFSFSNIDKFSTAGLITRLTTDVSNLQNSYQMILRFCVRAPFSLITALIMAFIINARISMIYLIAVIFLGIILFVIAKCAMKYFSKVFDKYDELNASIQENITGIRVVKSFVREEHEKNKFLIANSNICKMFSKAEKIVAYNGPAMQLTVYACILGISWLGAKMIVGSQLSTGELMSLLTYCMNILMSLMFLSMIFVMLTLSMASVRRVCEVLNEESDIKNPENPVMNVADGSISFKNVKFSYKKDSQESVLKDINIDIKSGETIGVIGGTGSAKTSLVNLISRLYDVTEGSIMVGGVDVRDYDLEVLRNQVAVVLQKNVLFSGTILDNLRWGNKDATEEECIQACKTACADEFIEGFADKYNTHIEQGGSNVSGGQKQRLCIARALLKNPKIMIFDDSTSAVDTATDAKIRTALANDLPDMTKIIIAQRISSVQHADRILVMDNGCVNGFGTHEELMASNEIYRDVFESQTSGSGDFDENGGEC